VNNDFSKKCGIPRYDRGANGELKLASFGSSGIRCSAPGRLDLVHLHALSGVLLFAPPPFSSRYTNKETSLFKYNFLNISGKMSGCSVWRNTGFFINTDG